MRNDIRAKMDDWAFKTKALMDELRNDSSKDAEFCAKQLSSAYENLNMQLGNQWGIKLRPVELPAFVIVTEELEPVSDGGGVITPVTKSVPINAMRINPDTGKRELGLVERANPEVVQMKKGK